MRNQVATENVYVREGFENRQAYLDSLADNYGVDDEIVNVLSDMLGESEDFDGLISELEDYRYFAL